MDRTVLQISPLDNILLATALAACGRTYAGTIPPISTDESDDSWEDELLFRAIRHRTLPALTRFAEQVGLSLSEKFTFLSKIFGAINAIQYRELLPVTERLRELGIPVMLLKGGDLALGCYPKGLPRMMFDLDILVRPSHLNFAIDAFKECGFVQGVFDRENVQVVPLSEKQQAEAVASHYELVPFYMMFELPDFGQFSELISKYLKNYKFGFKDGKVFLAVEYDLHFNLNTDTQEPDLWHQPRKIQFDTGEVLLGQSYSDLFWVLATRLYYEITVHNQGSLCQFIDLLTLMNAHHDAIDWNRVLQMVDKYEMHSAVFYAAWHVNDTLGNLVPQNVIDHCDPANPEIDHLKDWGDFFPKLFKRSVIIPIENGLIPEVSHSN